MVFPQCISSVSFFSVLRLSIVQLKGLVKKKKEKKKKGKQTKKKTSNKKQYTFRSSKVCFNLTKDTFSNLYKQVRK